MTRRPVGDKLARHPQPPIPGKRGARAACPLPSPTGHCYGYGRVSTVQQADEGESLDVQQRQIAGYAQMHGLVVDKVFVERGVSGSKPLGDRPQGAALLAVLQPGDVVITPKLDRMFSCALDALDVLGRLKAAGVSLHMIDLGGDTTGNGVSKLVFTILSAVAEAERDRTRERIAEVKRDQRQRGRYLGGIAPFGWHVGEAGRAGAGARTAAGDRDDEAAARKGSRAAGDRGKVTAAGLPISHVGVKKALAAAARRTAA